MTTPDLIVEQPHYTDPLATAVMAMEHGIKLRVELTCGTKIAMGDWLVMECREKWFRRAFIHSESMAAFTPQVGDIVHYWKTTKPDYFSQSTAERTKEHTKRVTKNVLFSVTHCTGLSRMRILTRNEKAFFYASREQGMSAPDTNTSARCAICDWPLAESADKGCVEGNCSYRPDYGTEEGRRVERNRIAVWAASPEGQRQLAEAAERAAADIELLKESRRLDWKLLNTPVDM